MLLPLKSSVPAPSFTKEPIPEIDPASVTATLVGMSRNPPPPPKVVARVLVVPAVTWRVPPLK